MDIKQDTTPLQLPQELIDNIIDHLHDSPRELKACSLVSHSFHPRSHFNFFQRVDVRGIEAALRFFTHLSPETRAIIRTLTLSAPDSRTAVQFAQLPWIPCLQSLHLNHLILRRLELDFLKTAFSGLHITYLETQYCSSSSVSEFRSMLWSLPSLTTLIVIFPYFDDHSDRDNDSPSRKSALSTLTTTKCDLLSPLFLTNLHDLRRLNIALSFGHDVRRFAHVVQAVCASLRHLSLEMEGNPEVAPPLMMPPLQSFTFKVFGNSVQLKSTLAWGMNLLEVNASNLAESIEIITFRPCIYDIPTMNAVLAHIEAYKVLDTLADLFPLVKKVHIAFVFMHDGLSLNSVPTEMLATLPSKDDMTDTITKVLPKLAERKTLVVDACEFTTVENEAVA
ncbi:hypothetical protein BDZ89DRAFT_1064942 [Hymenopellis radicata]|nr:hypothetical protein BDZ89DRAFT_1064942 [Hymenopellis radicata]